MVMQNHEANAREGSQRFEQFRAEIHVGLHSFPFFGIQRTTLVEDGFRDADFSDVVKYSGKTHLFDFGFGHAERFGKQGGVSRNFLRVTLSVLILGINGVSEGRDRIENGLRQGCRAVRD